MFPAACTSVVPIPPPAYHRMQHKRRTTVHLDALTLVTRLHLLSLCRLAVHLGQRRCLTSRCDAKGCASPSTA